MKITYKNGDLFYFSEKALAHGCNARGVMGSGVAKIVKEKYPEAYFAYRTAFETTGLQLGTTLWVKIGEKFIINAITQQDYGRKNKLYVSYDAIRKCIREINSVCFETQIPDGENITSVAFPKIGAGLANGDWEIIEKIIEEESIDFIPVVYCL